MKPAVTVLCVTEGHPHAPAFLRDHAKLADQMDAWFVIGADGDAAMAAAEGVGDYTRRLKSQGSMESVLDEMLAFCPAGYVLRIDDDELPSPGMRAWLVSRGYEAADHWCFPRANLYPDRVHHILTSPLWPDVQTRLSVREKSGGRPVLHMGSPFGPGMTAPVVLEHFKFIVRTLQERRDGLERNEKHLGAGEHHRPFSVPEDYPQLEVVPYRTTGLTVAA